MKRNNEKDKLPAVELRKKNGKWLSCFYVRVYENGVTRVRSTDIEWKGTPPASMRDNGDDTFEASRRKAQAIASEIRGEAAKKGRDTKLEANILELKTGDKNWKDLAISRLPDIITAQGTKKNRRKRSTRWEGWRTAVVRDFVTWARYQGKVDTVLSMTKEKARGYIEHLLKGDEYGRTRTAKTVRSIKQILKNVFDEVLPEDKANSFGLVEVETTKEDKEYHREPLNPDQVEALLKASEDDPLIHDLIVTGLCTGLRRGDCCTLGWKDVDLKNGILKVKTSKTGAEVYLPILSKLRQTLEGRLSEKKDDDVYVFPQAAWKLKQNPGYLTERVKRAFARALEKPQEINPDAYERVSLGNAMPRVLKAVEATTMPQARRDKITDLLSLYAAGNSFRDIQAERDGLSRGSISLLLHETEELAKVRFLPDVPKKGEGLKRTIRDVLRSKRQVGRRSASLYDFHCLRTTFCTQALKSGHISVEELKALTGHTTVELVLRHYFRLKGSDLTAKLTKAMAPSLTTEAAMIPVTPLLSAASAQAQQPSVDFNQIAKALGLNAKKTAQLEAMLKGGVQ